MKRVSFSILLAAVLCLIGIKAQAYDLAIENDGVTIYYNYIHGATELAVSSGNNSYSGDVTIPEEVTYENNTLRVTSIGNEAFENDSGLTSVTIPNSVTSIGNYAFSGCSRLTSVTIPSSVKGIGNYAFSGCSCLTSVTIPSSVKGIGSGAFRFCSGLTSVTIPSSVTSIGDRAFTGCTGLTSVTIPNSVTSIGEYAFSNCRSLTTIVVEDGNTVYDSRSNCNAIIETSSSQLIAGCKNTVIPNNVTSIGTGAFSGCGGLTSVTIPNSVTSIGKNAFQLCYGLTSVTIPNSVTSIGEQAFYECTVLTSVTISNGVTSIGKKAFQGCRSLTSINIPSGVMSIGEYAFEGCSNLTSVTIPNSATIIGERAFLNCDIPKVISMNEEPFAIDEYTFSENTYYNATLYVPAGSIDKYKAVNGWKKFVFIEGMCSTPTISFVNGEVVFACETEDVEFVPTVTCVPQQQLNGNKLKLGSTFTVSVFATKEGCLDSDVATMTLDVSSVGDVNGDGEVNVSDVTALVSIILGQ